MAGTAQFQVADAERVQRTLDRMAAEIHGTYEGDVHVVGVERRGVPVAEALAKRLAALRGSDARVGRVTLKRYADDLTVLHARPKLEDHALPFEVAGSRLLIVDDVFFTGRTLLRAATHYVDAGALEVRAAVLCWRGRPEAPVAADHVGMRLDVGVRQVIEVHAPPFEPEWGVFLASLA